MVTHHHHTAYISSHVITFHRHPSSSSILFSEYHTYHSISQVMGWPPFGNVRRPYSLLACNPSWSINLEVFWRFESNGRAWMKIDHSCPCKDLMLKKRFRYNIMISPTPLISTLHTFFPLSTFFYWGIVFIHFYLFWRWPPPPPKKNIHFTSQKKYGHTPQKMLVRGSLNGAKRHIYIHTQEQTKTTKTVKFREKTWLELVCLFIGLGSLLSCLPPFLIHFQFWGLFCKVLFMFHVQSPENSSIFCLKSFLKTLMLSFFVRHGQWPEKKTEHNQKTSKNNIRKHRKLQDSNKTCRKYKSNTVELRLKKTSFSDSFGVLK